MNLQLRNNNTKNFWLWFALTLIVLAFINPLDIAIWRDRAYLMYMSQTIFRGADLYETTPFGYTPLAPLLAGNTMSFLSLFIKDVDTVLVSRVMGMLLHALIMGSLFILTRTIFQKSRPAHVVCLLYLGFAFYLELSAVNFEPKSLALFLEIWAIYSLLKSKHLIAGLLFSLAAMCWHPMVINCLMVIPFFISLQGFSKPLFNKFILFSTGVALGTIPCLLYLYITNDWQAFWDQAIVRKVNVEGDVLFNDPLAWVRVLFSSKLFLDATFLVIGLLGLFLTLIGTVFKKSRMNAMLLPLPVSNLLLLLSLGWIGFNSLEFQGAMDFLPLVPLILIFSIFPFCKYLNEMSVKRFRLVLVIIGVYAFFDFIIPNDEMTYTEQKAQVLEMSEAYGDAIVINFEEYYVIRERQLPIPYMRLARFEDDLIDRVEINGCTSVVDKIKSMKTKYIISKRTTGKGTSSIGLCGQQILDSLAESLVSTHEFQIGKYHPLDKNLRVFTFDVYATTFAHNP